MANHYPIPRFVPARGQFAVTKQWANDVRECLIRLARRQIPQSRGGGGGGAESELDPWEPTFFTEGSEETLVYKCRFNLGTVNQVVATNWNDAFTLSMDEGDYHFVVLTITAASGKVTGVSISIDATPPTEDSISSDTPPVSFQIVLGAIGRTEAKMIVNENLQVAAVEVFRETKTAPAVGAEPFSRWWRWEYVQS